MTRRLLVAVALAVCASTQAAPRMYQLRTETGMPHLDENLRYAVRDEQRCLQPDELARVFWMLDDVSLQDCRLVGLDDSRYELRCDGGHGTTGSARWQRDGQTQRGTLDVRLGGKNMTFWQRVTARELGDCR